MPTRVSDKLLHIMKQQVEPGVWVVAVDETSIASMFTMSISTEWLPTDSAIELAPEYAPPNFATMSEQDKFMCVANKARAIDKWNRNSSGNTLVHAALSSFADFTDIRYANSFSGNPEMKKRFQWKQMGTECHTLSNTVKGFMGYASGFDDGVLAPTAPVKLEDILEDVHKNAPALHIITSCWKIVVIDARGDANLETSHLTQHEFEMPTLPPLF